MQMLLTSRTRNREYGSPAILAAAELSRPHYYHPQNPVKTPSYYPQSKPSILDDKSIYQRLELDQLFYIFYYMVGTYEQCVLPIYHTFQAYADHYHQMARGAGIEKTELALSQAVFNMVSASA